MLGVTNLAPDGPLFSKIVLGFMNLADWEMTPAELQSFVDACLDLGVTTLDHADIYGGYRCEEIFGTVLATNPSLRQKMQLISKCGIMLKSENRPEHRLKYYDTSRAHIIKSVENSLRLMNTDHLDLLLIHRPDPLMDPDDTAAGLTEVVESGKVRHIGVSNFTPSDYDLLASRLDIPLVTNQIEFSVMQLDPLRDGTFDHCFQHKIVPMAWSPLAGGRIFSRIDARTVRIHDALQQIGEELGGVSMDQVALSWIMSHPMGALPVLGTGKLERVESAAEATRHPLNRQQWYTIYTASTGVDVP